MAATVIVTTRPCVVCKETAEIEVRAANYRRFLQGALIQEAFPDLDADQRELLMSGTHAHCWVAIYGTEDEE